MKRMRRLVASLALVALMLSSCSCQQRLQYLQRHCPECFQQDTLRVPDTVVPAPIPILGHLSWSQLQQQEPVVLQGSHYTLDVTLDGGGLTLEGTVTPDTIVREIPVPVDRPVIVKESEPAPLPAWAVLAVLALFSLWGLATTIKNR